MSKFIMHHFYIFPGHLVGNYVHLNGFVRIFSMKYFYWKWELPCLFVFHFKGFSFIPIFNIISKFVGIPTKCIWANSTDMTKLTFNVFLNEYRRHMKISYLEPSYSSQLNTDKNRSFCYSSSFYANILLIVVKDTTNDTIYHF